MTNLGKVAIGTGGGVTTAAVAGGTYVALNNKDSAEDKTKEAQSQDAPNKVREEEKVVEKPAGEFIPPKSVLPEPDHREGFSEADIMDIEDDSTWTAPFHYTTGDGKCNGVFYHDSNLQLFKEFLKRSNYQYCKTPE